MSPTKKLVRELFFELMLLCAGVVSVAIFYNNNIILSFLLIAIIAIWAIGIRFWHKKHDVYCFVTGAIFGSIAEIVCIYFGGWQYANPTFLGIPIWLPLAWGFVILLIKRIADTFVKIGMK